MEHVPFENRGKVQAGFGAWVVRMYWGRFYVHLADTRRDRAQVSGVWERMWRAMPVLGEHEEVVVRKAVEGGEQGAPEEKRERRPAVMRNRGPSGKQNIPARTVQRPRR